MDPMLIMTPNSEPLTTAVANGTGPDLYWASSILFVETREETRRTMAVPMNDPKKKRESIESMSAKLSSEFVV